MRGLWGGLLAVLMVVAGAGVAHAGGFKTPEAALRHIYEAYGPDSWPKREDVFSTGLMELVRAEEARTPPGEIGNLDFDPFSDSQDPQPHDVHFGKAKSKGGVVVIPVTFVNADAQRETVLSYTLVEESDGWRVDDIEARGDYPWGLREILTEANGN
ncbi:hypothetical protein GCM10011321_04130 [Youhaiella tibetensis]|uniref:DUF3828 domain-containing protein n=1 Tax=Paradevosia tibetensis TaxID=1447062 RepID=A0A5B9DPR3_9HYPH|nr:DUF3828 domain-containing protein [Youhaiella tibetensis]QEE21390.1 DUF3828 domain-containing protein [Youhaiella tibetensis]GGF15415.1 hypothetical protein GCM10011321_04130 [Youhaiella tibetensis]